MSKNYVKDFKILMEIVRKIPIIMAVALFVMIIVLFFDINLPIVEMLFGMSLSSLLFFYLSSFVFLFCYYHRLPLYYIFASLVICLCDLYIGLPISTAWLFVVHIVLFLVMVVLLVKFYLK